VSIIEEPIWDDAQTVEEVPMPESGSPGTNFSRNSIRTGFSLP
jgi:hypothetical protein